MNGASFLLAGAVETDAAESLAAVIESELAALFEQTVLVSRAASVIDRDRIEAGRNSASPSVVLRDVEDELQRWAGLLYKPNYASVAQNACFDPAIARVLDQCGGI